MVIFMIADLSFVVLFGGALDQIHTQSPSVRNVTRPAPDRRSGVRRLRL
ncbi:hypothetical protein NCC78_29080 [Micromonospora phytophila]|nr:hypothetical protein [Micromonospora phytophila]MCM0678696.1 hypothetical protein [Micromonospora phytophila]